MPPKRVKCFVAMAFGKQDCDTLYDKCIVPTLRWFKFEPIRIDRREHKDDLNNYIIRMLKESDIALADLKYSRPSVYYEAGFAERQIPVVYTVRKDHLSRTLRDDRLWVHFDLEMKKIVSWHDPNDSNFVRRLKVRIAYLAKPIIKQRQENELIERDRLKFASLSVASRCQEIYKKFKLMLKSKRYWTASLWDIKTDYESRIYSPLRFLTNLTPLIGIKKVNKTCQICTVLVAESLTKKQIETAIKFIKGSSLVEHTEDILDFDDHFFLCSLRSIPESRLTACFPSAQPTQPPTTFTWRSSVYKDRERRVSIYFVSPISSMTRLRTEIRLLSAKLSDKESSQRVCLIQKGYRQPEIQFESN